MKLYLLLCFLLVLASSQDQTSTPQPLVMKVGQIMPGKINPEVSNQHLHPIYIDQLQKKYLFIRLSTFDTNQAAIGLYWNMTGQLVYSCMDNSFDTCYIPTSQLIPDREYVILVMSNTPINYNLYTYWGDLEHLKPDEEIKFMFDSNDKTQLFHLDLDSVGEFQQIRIIMRPETMRAEGDSLKIFANKGYKEDPTQEKHDYQSIHVWNDAQAIFISKKQVQNEKGIAVYIVGNAKTVYLLSCEFIRKDHHNIKLNENLYEYINNNEQAVYHMKFEDKQNLDVHVVRFSVFTGEVEVGFYYDKEMNNYFKKYPYQYMSDMQFHIDKADLAQGTKDLYMKVRARDMACTFQLNLQGRSKVESFQMNENIFEFVPIKQKIQSMHFYSHIWNQNQYDVQKWQTFDISMIKVQGSSTIEFYKCKPSENEDICKQRGHKNFAASAVKINPIGQSTVGTKIIYTIQVEQADYKDINSVEKRALVIIHVKSEGEAATFVALQVSNSNKVRLLREGRSFEDKVRLSQTKYYKYISNNPNIGAIKIHINQISGLTKILAYRSDSKQQESPIQLNPQEPNTILITSQLTKPIFLHITGIVTSIYTISVMSIHKEHPLSNSLVMAEDISYEIKLLPYSHTNVQLHPIEGQIVFEYNSDGGSIVLCELDGRDLCKQGTEFVGNRGEVRINAENVREVKLRLGNYANTTAMPGEGDKKSPVKPERTPIEMVRTVKVTMLYHAAGRQHCQQRKINKVYSELVKSGSCFNFHLPLAADIELLASRQNLAESQQLYFVCSKKVQPEQAYNRYIIRGQAIKEACLEFENDMSLSMIVSDSSAHGAERNLIRVDFSVQYTNDTITLADGVAYYTRAKSLESAIKTFFYQIVDEFNSFQIVLLNKKGSQFFLAKIVENPNRYRPISESQATINSKNSNYYANPSIQISSEDIVKANCGRNCLVVISVFSREKPGTDVEFGIEVTQHQVSLKEGEIRSDYLSKGSIAFYQYLTRVRPTDLLFKISDNNRKCAVSYLSNHPFPSPSNYIAYENQGSLAYKNAQKQRYYFAVEALQDCPYTISVNEGNNKLTKIEHGQYYDIKLNEGEEVWFYLRHLSKSSFKILSLLKHGLVDISVNRTELDEQVIGQVSAGKVEAKGFGFRNSYQNCLTVSEDAAGFCFDCYYLVNVKAKTLTEGSIFLGSENSKISLETGKVLFDEIKTKDTSTLALFYKISKGTLVASVYSGKIKVEMSYDDQKFEKTLQKNKVSYNESYEFQHVENKFMPLRIKITAVDAPAVYSFQLYPLIDNTTTNVKVSPGLSSFLTLTSGQPACFSGTLRAKDEYIYISSDKTDNINLSELTIDAKLSGKDAKIEKEVIGNILSVKFQIEEIFFAQAQPYVICLQPRKATIGFVLLSLMQNQKMNLISPDTELIVRGEGTYAIHQNGYAIIDLFECSGKAEVTYSSELAELERKTAKQLDVIGISGQNHAIRVESQEVLFLKVKLDFGSLLWMPLNEQKERGVGYYKYSIGNLAYTTGFNTIKFLIGGVFKAKETNTSVQSVKYNLHISNSRQTLQKAVLCQINPLTNVISVQLNSSKVGDGIAPEIEVNVEKKKISETFKNDQTLYFNVVADLTLIAPNEQKDHEHYRFVYFEQLVLAQLLKPNLIEEKFNFNFLIAGVAIVSIGLIAVLCVFVKWVVPALGRLRSRVLVEQNNEDKDVEMEAPPSSDRNQMATGTTDRMS